MSDKVEGYDEYLVLPRKAREYRCNTCGQLRLSLDMPNACGNCFSTNLTIGLPGELPTSSDSEQGQARADF